VRLGVEEVQDAGIVVVVREEQRTPQRTTCRQRHGYWWRPAIEVGSVIHEVTWECSDAYMLVVLPFSSAWRLPRRY